MGRLDGRVALVTGAARGTGAAIAERFVDEGATVVVSDILDERGAGFAEKLGDRARYRHLDVTSEGDWGAAIDDLRHREGRLDVLVNNAAILHLSVIDVTATQTFTQVMTVNVLGPFLGTRFSTPLMREGGGGSIVNIGSIDSVQGTPATAGYTASKFAVLGLTKVTAIEYGKYNIRANCICPAAGSDEMLADAIVVAEPGTVGSGPVGPAEAGTTATTGDEPFWPQPIGRRGYPSDMAGAAVFFASDDSAFCTGASLLVDGGHTAGHYIGVPGVFTAST